VTILFFFVDVRFLNIIELNTILDDGTFNTTQQKSTFLYSGEATLHIITKKVTGRSDIPSPMGLDAQ
jgi:hypothetical protein